MNGNFLMWFALLVSFVKIQKQIKQKSIINENCCVAHKLFLNNSHNNMRDFLKIDKYLEIVKASNIDLFQNITSCISEKKQELELQKAAKPYELEDIILWTMILFYCIDLLIGRR